MKVEIQQLEKAFANIIEKAKELGIRDVEIKEDYYWNIDQSELYEIYSTPRNLNLGSLCDNLSEIVRIIDDPDETIIYSLVSLGSILRAIGLQESGRG